jgi:AbrB family looped-hinge helix DNA binding protein
MEDHGAMGNFATTKMSSKGQVVIPEEIRERLGLEPGVQFVVIGDRDVVILKAITPPSMKEFDDLVASARAAARKAKMKRSDVSRAVSTARARR